MTKSNENLTKERKSFKEVLVENKGKIITGACFVGTIIAGIIAYKSYEEKQELTREFTKKLDELVKTKKELTSSSALCSYLNDRLNTTEDILVNSDIIGQARATMTRKKDTLVGKLNCLKDLPKDDDIVRKISELTSGIVNYENMLDNCDVLEDMYLNRHTFESLLDE